MDTSNALFSLAGVVIGQIPLVVKLYLEYKAKKDPFRQELFLKLLNIFQEQYALLGHLHSSLFHRVNFFGLLDAKNDMAKGLNRSLNEDFKKWREAVDRDEYLLPAELVGALFRYYVGAPSRLLWKIEKRNLWLKKKDNHASYQLATRRLRSHEVYQGRTRSYNRRGVAVFDGRPQ